MQSTLRENLLIRDGICIVSGKSAQLYHAAQLVPKRRTDIYATIFGPDVPDPAYETSAAVLLVTSIHRAYDMFQCSFYTRDDKIICHSFDPRFEGMYHGKVIDPATVFRLFPGHDEF